MLLEILNPIYVLISFTSVFGLFIHDTRIDKVFLSASESSVVNHNNYDHIRSFAADQHTHSEGRLMLTSGLNSHQPSTQPRGQDDKKYVAQKRLMGNGTGTSYIWPSI